MPPIFYENILLVLYVLTSFLHHCQRNHHSFLAPHDDLPESGGPPYNAPDIVERYRSIFPIQETQKILIRYVNHNKLLISMMVEIDRHPLECLPIPTPKIPSTILSPSFGFGTRGSVTGDASLLSSILDMSAPGMEEKVVLVGER